MKVTFLKQHDTFREGGEYDVEDGLANYLVKVGVVSEVKKAKEETNTEVKAPAKVVSKTPKKK